MAVAVLLRSFLCFAVIIGTNALLFLESYHSLAYTSARIALLLISGFFVFGLCRDLGSTWQTTSVPLQPHRNFRRFITVMGIMVASASLTHYLNVDLGLGAVIASGLITTIGALCFKGEKALVVYVASIAGMSSAQVLSSYPSVIVSAALLGILYLASDWVFNGVGGKFGTITAGAILLARSYWF